MSSSSSFRRTLPEDRFLAKVDPDACWHWFSEESAICKFPAQANLTELLPARLSVPPAISCGTGGAKLALADRRESCSNVQSQKVGMSLSTGTYIRARSGAAQQKRGRAGSTNAEGGRQIFFIVRIRGDA